MNNSKKGRWIIPYIVQSDISFMQVFFKQAPVKKVHQNNVLQGIKVCVNEFWEI